MLEYRVLGPLQVVVDGRPADLGGPRQRRLLAVLLVHRNAVVATDRLVDAVFAGKPTPRAPATLRTYVTRLRKTIGQAGPSVLQRQADGYRLEVPDSAIDVAEFERLVVEGRRVLAYGDAAAAVATLRRALRLWRGNAYEELADEPWLQPEVRRLGELRLVADEHLVDAEMDSGRAREMVAVLERLIADEPFRDSFRARLMLALYRSGRPADALTAYRGYRQLLADELGIDPRPELVELERRILAHDPSLRSPEPAGRPLRGYRLGERLGSGRHGVVRAARLPGVVREYAIRLYPADVADEPTFVRSFEADARRVASLDHAGVVPIHDAWREPGAAALVMRRMLGGTLLDRLAAGPLDRSDATAIFERVGGALVVAARRGVRHGNLRASSVLFDADGSAHLGDFALGVDRSTLPDDAPAFRRLVAESCSDALAAAVRTSGASEPLLHDRLAVEATVEDVLTRLRADPAAALPRSNPYVGLRAFGEADADRFFGREALVEELLRRVTDPQGRPRLVLVVGGSGSGKSSAVRAGLLPRLRREHEDWLLPLLLPGSAPFKELAEALRGITVGDAGTALVEELRAGRDGLAQVVERIAPPGGRVLLVIDQLDELFSLGTADESDLFLDAVAAAVAAPGGRLSVVATLRADFFDRPLEHPRFAAVVHGATVTVPTMTAAELETAVTGPAADLRIEPGLTAELVSSVVDQPAALPALQFALYEMAERGGSALTRAGLAALGGVEGAISARAEQLFTDLDADDQAVVRRVFDRLVVVEPTGEPARRRATRSELVALGDPGTVDRLVEAWVQARLLTTDRHPETREPTVEVAHEAVLQRWPRLQAWIDADREWLRALTQLQQAARTWQDLGEDAGALLRGARLERAVEVTAEREGRVPDGVRRLLEASVEARDTEARRAAEEAERRARTTRRLRTQRWALAAALLLALAVGGVAIDRQAAASRSAAEATARARAATAGLVAASDEALGSDWSLALLLAAEARRIDDSPATRRGLLTALTTPRPIPTTIHEQPGGFQAVAVDEERGLVIAKERQGQISVLDRDTGERRGESLPAPALFRVGGLDVRGGLVAAGGLSTDGIGAVVYDIDTRELLAEIPAEPDESAEVSFSPDGRRLAVTGTGRVRVYDVAEWEPVAALTTGDGERLIAATWSEDGTRVYAGGFDGTAFRWDVDAAADGETPLEPARRAAVATRPEPTPIGTITPIPGSDLLAVAAFDPSIYLVDADSLRIVEGPLVHDNVVFGLSVAPTGDRIAVAAANRVVLWSLDLTRRPDEVALGRTPTRDVTLVADGTDAAFSATGELVTVGLSGEVISWELDPASPAMEPIPDAGPGFPTFSPDGDVLAMAGGGAGVRLLDADTYQLRSRLDIPAAEEASIGGVAFLPGSSRVAVTWCPATNLMAQQPCPGQLAVFDRESGDALVGPVEIDRIADWVPASVAASSDGARVAVGYVGARVEVRNARTLEPVATLDDLVRDGANFVLDMSFSSERPHLLTATTADDAAVWDLSGEVPEVIVAGQTGLTTHFTPDDLLVTSDIDGTLELRDPTTLEVLDDVSGLPHAVLDPSFTRDGSLMVTNDDFTAAARLWRLDDLELFGGPIDARGGAVHPDGTAVVLGGDPVRHLSLDPEEWSEAACATAGRNLTRDEWSRYFAEEPYRQTCPTQTSSR